MSGVMAVGAAMGAMGDDLPRTAAAAQSCSGRLPLAGQSEEGGRLLSSCWIVSWRLFAVFLAGDPQSHAECS